MAGVGAGGGGGAAAAPASSVCSSSWRVELALQGRALRLPRFLLLLLLWWCCCNVVEVGAWDDGDALLELRAGFSTSSDGGVLPGWDRAVSPLFCLWNGVECSLREPGVVVGIFLNGTNLSGELSPSVGKLLGLEMLYLNDNHLSGQIPWEIGRCEKLRELDLSGNLFSGDIPYSIPQLKFLETLSLKGNRLTGRIPTTLSQLPNLKELDLASNRLTGEIPSLLYWSNVLQYLGLRENFLTGELSPDMCRLNSLWYFDVQSNNITGPIPDNIGNCSNFQIMSLGCNQLIGPIPPSIGYLQVSTLSLQNNRLTGPIPEVIGLMQALIVVDLSGNLLEGSIPPNLGNLTYADKLYLNDNRLTGTIPPELGNISSLSYLQLNNNQLTGEIPPELGMLQELFQLILSGNQLHGPLPPSLGNCTALNYLDVHHNFINGSIPLELEKLDNLTFLNLSSNLLSGPIPKEVCYIINLDTLDFSNNQLTGPIPPLIGNLEHLLTLVLRGNEITGGIPVSIGNLSQSLTVLDLSENRLSGGLPLELGQMQQLETLFLNNNSLSGPIPPQLLNGYSLKYLNLSYNNLSGDFAVGSNKSRFSADSFLGNPLMCSSAHGTCTSLPSVYDGRLKASGIWGIAVAAACLMALSIFLVLRWTHPDIFMKGAHKAFQGGSYLGPPSLVIFHMGMALHSYEELMRITDNLSEKFLIGRGATSAVFKCALKSGQVMAIKKLYSNHPENVLEFKSELETVGNVKHRNLLSLRGYLLAPTGNLLFYDYMENGSLWDALHGEFKKARLDWGTRLNIAVGAAQGLAYLHHNCSPRIIHRDVKSSNILLDANYDARLADFGIAKSVPMSRSFTSTYVVGTIGYIDPEYAQTSRLNEKSDVYSFGIVLLELLTGKKAVDDSGNLLQWVGTKLKNHSVVDILDEQVLTTSVDASQPEKAVKLALLCTRETPSLRPNMYEVSQVLLSMLELSVPKLPPVPDQSGSSPGQRRYLDDYVESKHRKATSESNSSDDAHLLLQFGEVISQNTSS